jgi:tetratricopeptide (TPR) repeat protein
MAASANFGAATLAKAASGSRLPSWEITRAYVTACGGDLKEWRARWESAAQRLTSSGETGEFALGTVTPARGEGAIPVPAQLAQDVPGFTGRAAELAQLGRLLPPERTRQREAAPVICALDGPAGIGKTALAVRFAHQVAHRFPDGQLYVNLRGFDPSGAPLGPGEVLRGLLGALGIAPDLMPADVQARSALFRSLLSGKAMMLLLDNARDAEQVRPLLPAGPGCLVIVTSRSQLTGLIAREAARPLTLDVLTLDEAIALLIARIRRQSADAEYSAVAELAHLCAGLPLALVIVAARAAIRPGVSLTAIASELRQARSLLDSLATGDAATDIRTVFSWSYEQLPDSAARVFRLLGLHPGPDFTAFAAASLADIPPTDAQVHLRALSTANLLFERLPGRFTFHDLLRAYAADLANAPQPSYDARRALGRLIDYHLSTAAIAMDLLHPAEGHRRPRVSLPAVSPPGIDNREAALTWLDGERSCLVAIIAYAATHEWHRHAILLSATVERYLEGRHHHEGLAVHGHARNAARQLADRDGEADAVRALGAVHWRQGSHDEAADHFRRALALYCHTNNQRGQARCLLVLGSMEADKGRYSPAVRHLEDSLALFRRWGDGPGESAALNNLADTLQRSGHTTQATGYLGQALALSRRDGDHNTEAQALQTLGEIEQRSGQTDQAAEHYQQALTIFRQLGHLRGEAWIMASLGTICNQIGRPEQAAQHHQQAIVLAQQADDRVGEAVARNGLGEDAYAMGWAAQALSHHAAALALMRGTQSLEQQARAHIGIARAHQALGHIRRAREHSQHARKLHANLGCPEAIQPSESAPALPPAPA